MIKDNVNYIILWYDVLKIVFIFIHNLYYLHLVNELIILLIANKKDN